MIPPSQTRLASSSQATMNSTDHQLDLDISHLRTDSSSKGRRGETSSSFNKSMDLGRHCVRTSSSGTEGSKEIALCGESYATMGDSFLGDSFAFAGNESFAFAGNDSFLGPRKDSDDYEYSDSANDSDLERIVREAVLRQSQLETVLDLEDDEEDLDSESKDDN
jgi:hypothetical protein